MSDISNIAKVISDLRRAEELRTANMLMEERQGNRNVGHVHSNPWLGSSVSVATVSPTEARQRQNRDVLEVLQENNRVNAEQAERIVQHLEENRQHERAERARRIFERSRELDEQMMRQMAQARANDLRTYNDSILLSFLEIAFPSVATLGFISLFIWWLFI